MSYDYYDFSQLKILESQQERFDISEDMTVVLVQFENQQSATDWIQSNIEEDDALFANEDFTKNAVFSHFGSGRFTSQKSCK